MSLRWSSALRPALSGVVAFLVAATLVYSPAMIAGLLGIAAATGLVVIGVGAIVPLEAAPGLVAAGLGSNPFPTGAVRIGLTTLVCIAIGVRAVRGRWPRVDGLSAIAFFGTVTLGGTLLLHGVASIPPDYSSQKAWLVVGWNGLVLLAGLTIGVDSRQIRVFSVVTLLGGVLTSTFLLRGLVTDSLEASVGGRFSLGAGDHPITLARFGATCVMTALFLIFVSHSRRTRWVVASALPLMAVTILAAGSRGPVLALAVGLIAFFALASGTRATRRQLATATVVLLPIGIYIVATEVPTQNIERATAAFSSAPSSKQANGRFEIWSEAARAFSAHPISGVGSGGFSRVDDVAKYPHNFVLETAAEAGMVGLLALGSILVPALIATRRAVAKTREVGVDANQLAFVVALLVMSLVNASFSGDLATNSTLWLAMGLVLGTNIGLHEPTASLDAT